MTETKEEENEGTGRGKEQHLLASEIPNLVCLTHTHLTLTCEAPAGTTPILLIRKRRLSELCILSALAPGESGLPEPRARSTGVRGGLPSTPPPRRAPSPAPLLQDPGKPRLQAHEGDPLARARSSSTLSVQ